MNYNNVQNIVFIFLIKYKKELCTMKYRFSLLIRVLVEPNLGDNYYYDETYYYVII